MLCFLHHFWWLRNRWTRCCVFLDKYRKLVAVVYLELSKHKYCENGLKFDYSYRKGPTPALSKFRKLPCHFIGFVSILRMMVFDSTGTVYMKSINLRLGDRPLVSNCVPFSNFCISAIVRPWWLKQYTLVSWAIKLKIFIFNTNDSYLKSLNTRSEDTD